MRTPAVVIACGIVKARGSGIEYLAVGERWRLVMCYGEKTRSSCSWLESERDSRIGEILIQPVGWAEASRNAEAVFARLA